ncbi:hypothetical protein M4E16_002903, partial [Listeria monocytogenes]|nr:hypothetical protein [Listeria monocytogenes]
IYESVYLDGDITEISFVIVYPNGNPPLDRHNILRDSFAKEEEVKLIGTDEMPLRKEPIEEYINEKGEKGYLKNIFTKGAFRTKIKQINNLNADKR